MFFGRWHATFVRRNPRSPPRFFDRGFHLSLELFVTHTIRFRRPELPYGVSRMFVPPEADAAAQIRHLEGLGYTIVDVSPPLGGYGLSDDQALAHL